MYNCRNKIIYSLFIRVCSCKCSVGCKSANSSTVLFEFPLTWTLFLLFAVDALFQCCESGSVGSYVFGSGSVIICTDPTDSDPDPSIIKQK
jgi:hypothetical protein